MLILTFMLAQVSTVFGEDPNEGAPDPNQGEVTPDPNQAMTEPNYDPYWDSDWSIEDPNFDPDWMCEPELIIVIYGDSSWTTYNGANTGGAIGNDTIRGVAIEPGGNKWIGTNGGGVARLTGTSWTKFTNSQGLPNNTVQAIAFDSGGNKWVATGGGVGKYTGTSWTKYTTGNSALASNNCLSIMAEGTTIWVGTYDRGACKLVGTSWTTYNTTNSGLPGVRVQSVAIEAGGTKWFTTLNGVAKYDGTTWTKYAAQLPSDDVYGVAIAPNNDKWFATVGGVSRFTGTSWTTYTQTQGLAKNDTRSIAVTGGGAVWAGSNGSGVSVFTGTIPWTVYNTSGGLPDDTINAVAAESSTVIWLGTGKGACKYDSEGTPPPGAPVAEFVGSPTSGSKPLTVNFTDQSTNSPTAWNWAFGDGGTSTIQNPSHLYNNDGSFTVSLTVSNVSGSNTKVKSNYIVVSSISAPVAYFVGSPTSGNSPLTVQFTDQSTGSPANWSWTFGDGGTSTAQNPSHIYSGAGVYTVDLTVWNFSGTGEITKANYITVSGGPPSAPVANFVGSPTSGNAPLTVQFTDQSTGGPTSWSWTFGDGGTSTAQNPSHQYTAGGNFTVSLTVSNAGGSDSETKTNYIVVTSPSPVPDFTASPRSGPAPLTVNFTDLSTGCIDTWKYNMDGVGGDDWSDSRNGNAKWTYQNAGVFTVILKVRDCDTGVYYTNTKPDYITVTLASPIAAFAGSPTSGEVPLTVQFTDQSTGTGINSWSWTFGDSGTSTAQNPSHQYTAVGSFTVSLTASNAAGSNKDTKTNYITVVDTTPPEISCPADVAVECGQSTEPASTGIATATDNSGLPSVIVFSDMIAGACPKVIVRTWKATDAFSNFATCEQTITVQDTTAPVFAAVPQDKTVESDGAGNAAELAAWLGGAAASDTCGSVTVTNDFGGLSDGCGATGSATVTWTATDSCGNTATTSATFTIVDTTAPVFTAVPQNKTVESDGAGNVAELNAWVGSAAGSDSGGSVTITNNFGGLSDGCGATGSATVTWTVTDECGNSATTSATFTIVDTIPPVFTTVPQDAVVSRDGNGNIAELNAWLASIVEATDVGGGVEITNNFTSFPYGCGNTGSATVTWTAEDACGNKSTTSATFTINDPTTAVTYDGDMLLSTAGAPTVNANLIASLRNQSGEVPNIDGEQVTFTLTADGVGTIVATASSQDGIASAVRALEPAIYTVRVTLGCSGLTAQGILVVFNPQGGFATGGGWILPANDGVNTHPNNRANFGFNAKYKDSNPTGNLEFRYTDGYIDLKSTLIDQLVITGGKIVQFKGQAVVNRQQGCRFFVKGIDNGEPGTNDTFEIKVWAPGIDPESNSPYERAAGALKGGNIQVHNK